MLAMDEEVDYLEYQRYLREQSNTELHDIWAHLDYVRCPRRAEAASREMRRREIDAADIYADSENIWRKFLTIAIAVIALTFLLGLIMSANEAVQPQPPPPLDLTSDGNFIQFEGNPLSGGDRMTAAILGVYAAQIAENWLRDAVQFGSQCGGYLMLLCVTLIKLIKVEKEATDDDPLKIEVRRLLWIGLFSQLLVIASAAWNNLPVLADGGHCVYGGILARMTTFLVPWG